MTAPKPATPSGAGKRLVFTGAMLLLPVLFFLFVEGGLRLFGYGADYPLFVEAPQAPAYRFQNRAVARRYFGQQTNPPSSQLDYFRAEKDSAALRLFVQGGSTAAGFPFYYGGSFSRMLEQRLLQTFPGRPVEVINTAMAAVNSYTLLDLSAEILAEQPDAVLIYAGHNEYYGALGVGSSESLGQWPFLVNGYLRLQRLRTVQALRGVLAGAARLLAGRGRGEAPSSTLMERMVGEQSIPLGSALYRRGLRQFRANLRALLATYQRHAVPVFIGTVASNERDHAPFISAPVRETDRDAWQAALRRSREAASAGDTTAALTAFADALALDTLAAETYFARARLLDAAGRYAEARADYIAAKERDLLRFRAPEAINEIIREEAARHGATVVETQQALAEASPGGIIGREMMMEHLHPTVAGYFVLADAFYEALWRGGFSASPERFVAPERARSEVLLTAVDSLNGVLRVRRLMRSWPFQPPGVIDRSLDTLRARDPVEAIALKLSRGEFKWLEAQETLRQHYVAQGRHHDALKVALAIIQEYPFVAQGYLVAGNTLVRLGRAPEAIVYFEAANDLEESPEAQRMLGSIYLQQAQRTRRQAEVQRALGHLERAVALAPTDVPALYNLSGAYALNGQYDRARQSLARLFEIAPNHADGRRLLSSLPTR